MHFLFMILLAVSPFQIDEVEVTAERAQIQSEAFRLVAQVGHEEIAQMPVKDVADILAYLPGVDVRSRGAMQRDVSLHGGTFDQVLILLNGVSLQDAQTGHYTMNIPVHPSMIERIEILQGTAVHLTGAFSGAINIVTRDAQQEQYTVALSGGSNSEISPVANGSWVRGETRVNASVDYARSDGYYAPNANEREQEALLNTDYQTANVYLQTRWRELDVQTGAQYKDAGLGTGYGHASTDQFDATRTLFASARYTAQAGQHWSLTAQAAYRTNYDRYEWHKGTAQPNIHWTHNAQAALQAHYASSIGRTSIGAECKHEYIRSSNMGKHNRTQVTCSAEQQFIWQGLAASIGIAGHYNSLFGWYGSGAANIGYTFRKAGSVYISATRSLRMPTWTDMYYKAGVQRGSEDLKAERAWILSVGGQYNNKWKQAGSLHLSGDVWYRWGQDIIDWSYNETDSLFYATNRHSVDAFGIDLVAQYKLNRWLRNITVRYAFCHLSLDLVQTNSQYLDYLRHKVTASVNHGIYVWDQGCVGAEWSLRWQDRRGTYVDIYGTAGNPFRPVLLMDGTIYMELAHVRVAIECTNMTNRHYYDYGGVLMQGIQGRLCVTAHF